MVEQRPGMSGRVWAVIVLVFILFVLAVLGLFAVFTWVTSSRAPTASQLVPAVQAPDTPTPAPAMIPCGDGTYALSQADCDNARRQPVREADPLPTNTPEPPRPTNTPEPARPTEPPVQEQEETANVGTGGGCTATPDNAQGRLGGPQFSVPDPHLISVQWWFDGTTDQQQSILPAGLYNPFSNVHIGAWWDYPNCSYDEVYAQAMRSNGSVSDYTNGFSKIQ